MEHTLVIVLAGGVGERLYLDKERAKPAVDFGGPYRIIDFTLSNCINSGLRRVFIATQYKSLSLSRHIRMGWNIVSEELGEFIEILPPQKRVGEHWYSAPPTRCIRTSTPSSARTRGSHRAVGGPRLQDGLRKMLRFHMERGAAATLATIEVPVVRRTVRHRRGRRSRRVVGFEEKPADARDRARRARRGARVDGRLHLRDRRADSGPRGRRRPADSHDFGKDIIPSLYARAPVISYRFEDANKKASKYWRDIGTLDAYYEANMDLCHVNPEFNLYDPEWPMRTHQPQAPPAKFVFAEEGRRSGQALDSIISSGCIISGSRINGSVLCPNVRVHSFCTIENSLLMPGVRVGRHARIRKGHHRPRCAHPRGALIGYNEEEDRRRHTVSREAWWW